MSSSTDGPGVPVAPPGVALGTRMVVIVAVNPMIHATISEAGHLWYAFSFGN